MERKSQGRLARSWEFVGPQPIPAPSNDRGCEPRALSRAQRLLDAMRERIAEFGPTLFSEAAWEMLLRLLIDEGAGLLTTGADLHAPGGASAARVRWLDALESQGLVTRRSREHGPLAEIITLTEPARERLCRYLLRLDREMPRSAPGDGAA